MQKNNRVLVCLFRTSEYSYCTCLYKKTKMNFCEWSRLLTVHRHHRHKSARLLSSIVRHPSPTLLTMDRQQKMGQARRKRRLIRRPRARHDHRPQRAHRLQPNIRGTPLTPPSLLLAPTQTPLQGFHKRPEGRGISGRRHGRVFRGRRHES